MRSRRRTLPRRSWWKGTTNASGKELCVVKTIVDEIERGGARVHDLFLLRAFMAVFGGPKSAWRAHDGQAYRYHDGAWKHAAAMNVQQAVRMERAVNQVDLILPRMSKDKNVRRPSWDEGWLLDYASRAAAAQVEGDDDPDESFSIARKMLRETLTRFLTTGNNNIIKTFCKWCDQQKRAEPRLAFKDACLKIEPGKAAVEIRKGPEVNCHAYMDVSLNFKPPTADVDRYDLMMATLYGNDVESKEIEGIGEALALMHQRQPPRVRVRKGKGPAPTMPSALATLNLPRYTPTKILGPLGGLPI